MDNNELKLIKKLREDTGAGVDLCKNAVIESNGDYEIALDILRLKGLEKAAKKVNNMTEHGSIVIKKNNSKVVLLNFRVETDFAVKCEGFCDFISNEAEELLKSDKQDIKDLEIEGKTFNDRLSNYASILGENITLNNFSVFYNTDDIQNVVYLHKKINKNYDDIASLVVVLQISNLISENELDNKKYDASYLIAKHIAASDSLVLSKEDITDEMRKENKNIEDFVLFNQPYFDNPELTVKDFADQNNIKIINFRTFLA